jgi:hypothetical protein
MNRIRVTSIAIAGLVAGCSGGDRSSPPTNQPPVVDAISDVHTRVGDTLRVHASARDPEGEEVAFRLVVPVIPGAGVAEASIDSVSGEFTFIPQATDGPLRWFGIFAHDRGGAEGSTDFYVLID